MEQHDIKKPDSPACATLAHKKLVVFSDRFNTLGHIAQTLIKACKHHPEQAEQCAWIVHYKGKCVVKEGAVNSLQPMYEWICDAGIKARIE